MKINNKGQVLVTFLLLLPLLLLFLGVMVENCYLFSEKQQVKGTLDIICDYALTEKDTEKIEKLAYQNDSDLKKVTVKFENNAVTVESDKDIKSIFGNIIGYSSYSYHTKVTCTK